MPLEKKQDTVPDRHLLAALVTGRVEPGTVAQDRWPALIELACRDRLGPMLEWMIKRSGQVSLSPAGEAPLSRATLRSARRYTLLDIAQREIQDLLQGAKIPAIWLKGAHVARTLYPDPTLRPMSDLDLLVAPEQCRPALDLLLKAGYQFAALDRFGSGDQIEAPAAKSNHHYELVGGPAQGVAVELHFRLLAQNDELLSLESLAWFRRHTEEKAFEDGRTYTVLAPEANLLYLVAHAMLQHGESEVLLHFLDLHLLISKAEPDWPVVVDQAVTLGWTGAVERALTLTREYYATEIPASVLQSLVERRPAQELNVRALGAHGAGLRWERARGTLAGMSAAGRMRYLWGSVFPSSSYMRRKYDVRQERPLWRLYVHRWRDQLADVSWAFRKRGRSPAGQEPSITRSRSDQSDSAAMIEQLLVDQLPVQFRAGGQSMRPVIRDQDLVRIRPLHERDVRVGAVLLFRRGDQLVTHRVIGRGSATCWTVADAAVQGKHQVPVEDILGVAEWVRHGDKTRRLDTSISRAAGVVRYLMRPCRRMVSRMLRHARASSMA